MGKILTTIVWQGLLALLAVSNLVMRNILNWNTITLDNALLITLWILLAVALQIMIQKEAIKQ